MEYLPYILIILFCVALEAFFSGSEIAVVSTDRIRLKHMLRKGTSGAKLLNKMIKRPGWLLGTTLVGTNLAVVVSNTIATYLVIKTLGVDYEYLTIAVMSPLLLVFAEVLPKTVFQQRSSKIAPKIILPLTVAAVILSPFVYLTSRISNFLSYLFGKEEKERDFFVTRDELELILKMSDARAGGMKSAQKKMIRRVFDFKETSVKEVMIPGAMVKGVEINEPVEEVISKLKVWKHSRVPVYKGRNDNVVGMINTFDFILPYRRKTLKAYVRPIQYFPEHAQIDEIMVKLQHDGDGMAAVVNEYGSVSGVVTLEDILEEVVGEIEDEYDLLEPVYKKVAEGEFTVSASMTVKSLMDELGIAIPEGDYETIGGFVLSSLKKIPKTGEICNYKNIQIVVTKTSEKGIEEVKVLVDRGKI